MPVTLTHANQTTNEIAEGYYYDAKTGEFVPVRVVPKPPASLEEAVQRRFAAMDKRGTR